MYHGPWASLKKATPKTPDEFMCYLQSIVPNLCEEDLIRVRRSERSIIWVHDVCDFIWVCMQPDRERWSPQIERMWPNILGIIESQNLEDAFVGLSI